MLQTPHWQQLVSHVFPLHTQPEAHLLQPDGQQSQQPAVTDIITDRTQRKLQISLKQFEPLRILFFLNGIKCGILKKWRMTIRQSSHYACWEDKQERNINRSTDYCLLCCEVLDLLFLQLLHEHFVHVQDPPQLQVPAAHKKSQLSFMWSAGNKQRIK